MRTRQWGAGETEIQFTLRECLALRLIRDLHSFKEAAYRMGVTVGRFSNLITYLRTALHLPTLRHLQVWAERHPKALEGEWTPDWQMHSAD